MSYNRKCCYGLSERNYLDLVKSQDGKCVICKLKKRLCVDHNHETGEVRGLLCFKCNHAIGVVESDIQLDRLFEYLKNPPARPILRDEG